MALQGAAVALAAVRVLVVAALAISTAKTYISQLETVVQTVAMVAANTILKQGREQLLVNLGKLLAIYIPAAVVVVMAKKATMALAALAAAQTAGKARRPTPAAELGAETASIKFLAVAAALWSSATIGKEEQL